MLLALSDDPDRSTDPGDVPTDPDAESHPPDASDSETPPPPGPLHEPDDQTPPNLLPERSASAPSASPPEHPAPENSLQSAPSRLDADASPAYGSTPATSSEPAAESLSPAVPPPDVPPSSPPRAPTTARPTTAPASHTPDRDGDRDEETRPFVQRLALAVLVIAAAALLGYALSRPASDVTGDTDALARSVEAAGELRLIIQTDAPREARRFVRDEFGWRVGVPTFDGMGLEGVAIAQTAEAVEVPVFLYTDSDGRNVAVFTYSYALLDQIPDRLRLGDGEYQDLDDGAPVVRESDGNDLLLWRDRDDIYVAVTDLSPGALIERLSMVR